MPLDAISALPPDEDLSGTGCDDIQAMYPSASMLDPEAMSTPEYICETPSEPRAVPKPELVDATIRDDLATYELIDRLLVAAKDAGASDLHLCTDCLPLVRVSGTVKPLEGFEVSNEDILLAELMSIAPEENKKEFEECNDTDFAYEIEGVSRFRVNVFRDRKGPGGVFRVIPFEIPSASQLSIPEKVLDLCNQSKGLVLVTGPTGSGHLVFGTLHTTTAPGTVDRIIDQFPADQQEQIRTMVADCLTGVIAQALCRKIGGGRVAAFEILIGNSTVSNLIREKKTFQLFSLMQTGSNVGMRTMNDSLIDLVRKNLIEPKEAYLKAVNKTEIRNLLEKGGFNI